MQNQQNPQNPQNQPKPNRVPQRDPTEVERAPGRDEDANDKVVPPPDRHRDPLQQPGDEPDVKPDVIAGRKQPGQGTGAPRPQSSPRQKQ